MQEARTEAAANLKSRGQLFASSRHIHDALWQGYTNLDRFLLDPNNNEPLAETSIAAFNQARNQANQLLEHAWLKGREESTELVRLPKQLDELLVAIDHLVVSRKDPSKQYPALEIGNTKIGPTLRDFANAMLVLVNEVSSEEQSPYFLQVFPDVVQTRYLWTQMVSNFRIYLANQFSAFDQSILRGQEEGVETLYVGLLAQLDKLNSYEQQEKLGFESADALKTLSSNANIWYRNYLDIKETYKTDTWRTDVVLMSTTIEPRLTEIWTLLQSFEMMLENSVATDISELNTSAGKQEKLLWSISLIIIIVAFLSFMFMRRLVFQPIENVTQALHDEAIGNTGIIVPAALTMETKNLIDAFKNMRLQIHNRQMALEHKSLYDELTGLPNRTLFFDRVQQSLSQAMVTGEMLAVVALEVRHLKEINDTFGHNIGDRVIINIGKRLQDIVGEYSTVARAGGDEFSLLLHNCNEEEAIKFSQKVDDALSENIHVSKQTFHISIIAGIATFPAHGKKHTQLYQRADIAKHSAKKNMRKVMVYSSDEDDFSKDRLKLMGDLKHAIEYDLLELHFQPKLELRDNHTVGVEALLRWHHSNYGWVNAEEIILIAEQCGLIDDLTDWTITAGIRQCAEWRKIGIELTMAINLSVHALQKENFAELVQTRLIEYNLPSNYLVLEITESAMMTNPMKTSKVVSQLDNIGIVLSADDFGTGFSSYTYLKHIPIDEIKIDKSFIVNMLSDETDTAIVKSAIDLAHSLGLNVVAEGVETEETRMALKKLNCEFGQGYQFSRALTAGGLVEWLNSQNDVATTEE